MNPAHDHVVHSVNGLLVETGLIVELFWCVIEAFADPSHKTLVLCDIPDNKVVFGALFFMLLPLFSEIVRAFCQLLCEAFKE